MAHHFQNGENVAAASQIDWQGSLKLPTGVDAQQTWGLYVSYSTLLWGVVWIWSFLLLNFKSCQERKETEKNYCILMVLILVCLPHPDQLRTLFGLETEEKKRFLFVRISKHFAFTTTRLQTVKLRIPACNKSLTF